MSRRFYKKSRAAAIMEIGAIFMKRLGDFDDTELAYGSYTKWNQLHETRRFG